MAEDSFKGLLIPFILISLFGILIIIAMQKVANDYNLDSSNVIDSEKIQKLNETVSNIEENSQNLKSSFEKQNIWGWSAAVGMIAEGIFGIARDMANLIFTPFGVVKDILENTLKMPSIVSSVIVGILIISLILAIWRLVKIGD